MVKKNEPKPYDGEKIDEKLASKKHEARELGFLDNIPLSIKGVLSEGGIKLRDLIKYKKGSVVPLEKLAGEPMDLMVNGEFFAKGEIVLQGGHYAIRITDLIEKKEVLEKKFKDKDKE